MKKKAIENGFEFVRYGKKHGIYRNPKTGAVIQIERHWSQEVKDKLMKRMKKVIGF